MNLPQRGFSLVELMVVLLIVGILAAIAVPGYGSYRIRTSRALAQTELLQLASLQEKIYLNSSAYSPNMDTAYTGLAAGGLGMTTEKTGDGRYDLAFVGVPAQTFEIRAIPAASSVQEGDGCLLIRENGVRQWHEGVDGCDSISPKNW